MMFGVVLGQRTTIKVAVGTTPVILETAKKQKTVALESIAICNTNAASRTVSLYVDNGSTQIYIFNELALAAKATVLLTNHAEVLSANEALKVVASGTGINVSAVLLLSNPNMATDSGVNTLSSVNMK